MITLNKGYAYVTVHIHVNLFMRNVCMKQLLSEAASTSHTTSPKPVIGLMSLSYLVDSIVCGL